MKFARSSGRLWVALFVFATSVASTLVVTLLTHSAEQNVAHAAFDQRVAGTIGALQARLQAYEQVLRGVGGLVAADGVPSPRQWHDYAESQRLAQGYPDLRALNFAQIVDRTDRAGFAQVLSADGLRAEVRPAAGSNDAVVVRYIEPASPDNLSVRGFDLASEPVRRAALEAARDSAQAVMTGPVRLVQDRQEGQAAPGALLVLPLYRATGKLETVEQRRDAAVGFATCVFHYADLIQRGGAPEGLRFELYDGTEAAGRNLLFQTALTSAQADHSPRFRSVQRMQVAGRKWLLRFSSMPAFEENTVDFSGTVLAGGLAISALLALIVLSLGSSEGRALKAAAASSQALRSAELREGTILSNTADGIFTADEHGTLRSFNPSAERIFGYASAEVIGRNLDTLVMRDARLGEQVPPWPIAADGVPRSGAQRSERIGRHKDGHRFAIDLAINAVTIDGRPVYVGAVSDISARKRVEHLLAESNAFWQSVLDNSPVAIITFDLDGLIRTINPAAERLLDYRGVDLVGVRKYVELHEPREIIERGVAMVRSANGEVLTGLDVVVHEARAGESQEREWMYLRRDGTQMPVRLTVSALRAPRSAEISGFLAIAYDVTERKRSEEYTRHIAQHDFLTGLPNRLLLHERVNAAIERSRHDGGKLGVMLIDLDHFKRINDSLGHHIGDQLLQQLADRLCKVTGVADTVARMGGDEFVVLNVGIHTTEDSLHLARQLLEQISQPFQLGLHELHVTSSIGVSVFPDDGNDMHALLKNADAALYEAKENGRNRVQMFTAAMVMAAAEKMDLEKALRMALQRHELSVQYQPLLNLRTGIVEGAEALIRWHHPERGWISPASFIPLAEQTGLIVSISDWLLSTACREMVEMQRQVGRPISLSVNFSPRQFRDRDLARYVDGVLKMANFPAPQLELEITEGVLMSNSDETMEMLRELHRLGVRVVIDDFGTGYSSLSYLTRFKIDKLKIDRSFVRDLIDDPADAAVTNAIIAMAHGLGVKVVAEGIETLEQLAHLGRVGCDQGQGFYFSRAVPAADFPALLMKLESERSHGSARFVFAGPRDGGGRESA